MAGVVNILKNLIDTTIGFRYTFNLTNMQFLILVHGGCCFMLQISKEIAAAYEVVLKKMAIHLSRHADYPKKSIWDEEKSDKRR